ncbi:YgcG family protein [Acaryochloris sp. IP29b_bin.148]|uniref:TPM domain-containing protein n=1 Tax=Acaryochloris sp. IP29b_bin.148 TaxID=2969218 RepID=UPI002615A6DD|nr:TPM domain-containing protein [Acaryochloris sp. IP29b_bin.148]
MFLTRLKQRERSLLTFILALSFSLFLSISSLTPSRAIPVSEVPNPRQDNNWVMDMADLLSPDSEAQLNQMISDLEKTDGAEIAVVTVLDTKPSASPKAFATELFNTWGIGKKGEDNGILFLVSKNERRTEIETGYGVESILPDAQVGNILRTQVTPSFKQGNFDAGIVKGTQAIIQVLEGGAVDSPTREQSGESVDLRWLAWIFFNIDRIAIALVSLFAIAIFSAMSFVLKRIFQHSHHYQMSPVDRTVYWGRTRDLLPIHWWVEQLRRLAGDTAGDTDPSPEGVHFRPLRRGMIINPTQDVFKGWWTVFGAIIVLWFALSIIESLILLRFQWAWSSALFKSGIALKFLLAWGWLGYELWCCTRRDMSKTGAIKTLFKKMSGFIIAAIIVGIAIPIEPIVLPGLLTAFGGACAWSLRLLRSLSRNLEVRCQSCQGSMQLMAGQALDRHLRPAERVARELGSTHYEGWQCPTCGPAQADNGFALHLFEAVIRPKAFSRCEDCDALTVVSTVETLQLATTQSQGEVLMTSECACCHQKQEKRAKTARLSYPSEEPTSSLFSNSSPSSSSSSNSSSSSSSSSGSSFGGGSSGGGGAGDSW